jgi:DNA-binding response OmpR family regulator/anti-sigma regulatory factor (Ser/Thr protein kinase)
MGHVAEVFCAETAPPRVHRVLVVDDHVQTRLVLTRLLERMGYGVDTAENGLRAVEAVAAVRPDIIIMDLEMPVMGGFEATERIRASTTGGWLPIVFLSATPDSAALINALNAGADDYLVKPVGYTVLRAKMRAVSRMLNLQRELEARSAGLAAYRDAEEERNRMAEHVIRRLAKNDVSDEAVLRHWTAPASLFSGDLVAAAHTPGGVLHVMLADGAGHGLAAALCALTVAQPFQRMTEKGYPLSTIVGEMNAKIREFLPIERFVATTVVSVDFKQQLIEIWNGGNPPLVVIGEDGAPLHTGRSLHLPLGVASDRLFNGEPELYHYTQPCQIVACSDGFFESAGWPPADSGARELAALLAANPAGSRFDALKAQCAPSQGGAAWADDVSMFMIACAPGEQGAPQPARPVSDRRANAGEWHFHLRLSAEQLKTVDVVPLLHDLVSRLEGSFARNPKLFLVLSELVSNAVDHGVLKLDSTVKLEPDGFQRYLQLRQEVLSDLSGANVEVRIAAVQTGDAPKLKIQVRDTGAGFDYGRVLELPSDLASPFGRGIPLVKRLCESVEYRGNGNEVEVLFGIGSSTAEDPRGKLNSGIVEPLTKEHSK